MPPPPIRSALVYAGTLIGAGFASGRELVTFFSAFGPWGLAGTALAGGVLGLGGWLLVARSRTRGAASLKPLLDPLPRPLGRLLNLAVTLFFFAGLIIMLSAAGAVAANQLHLPRPLGIGLLALAVLLACWWRTESLVRVNAVATPLLVTVVAGTALVLLARSPLPAAVPSGPLNPATGGRWWWAALLYAGYNLLAGAAVLPSLAQYGPGTGRGAAWGGLAVGGLAALGAGAAVRAHPAEELPLLAAAMSLSPAWAWFYAFNLLLALWTTAAGHLFGLAAGSSSYRARLVTVLFLALPPSFLPFPTLVANLYPLFGYLGLLLLAGLCPPPRPRGGVPKRGRRLHPHRPGR
ncbi:MAG: hypothetical protein ACPLPT_03900 [Moorellales bacterium]